MLVIEGPDNSGKTTLVDRICAQFPSLLRHKSPGPDADYDWWMRQLTQPPEALAVSIYDRFYFSELVYGPICRGQISLSVHRQEVIESLLVTAEPLIIHCKLIEDEALFNNRPQLFGWEVQQQAAKAYGAVFAPHWNLTTHDISHSQALRNQLNETVLVYLSFMAEWQAQRMVINHGRGLTESPDLMVVGQNLAKDNLWRTPFERSRSGLMVHSALRSYRLPVHKVWFTNAHKTKGGLCQKNIRALEREIELIRPRRTIAVGSKAAGLLGVLNHHHLKVYHPGYYLRKHNLEDATTLFIQAFHAALNQMEIKSET